MVLPGWGQWYVGRPFKAAIYCGGCGYFTYEIWHYETIYNHISVTKKQLGIDIWNSYTEAQKSEAVYQQTGYRLTMRSTRPRDLRNKYAWRLLGAWVIGMLDAYVDAHLVGFPASMGLSAIDGQPALTFSWVIGGN